MSKKMIEAEVLRYKNKSNARFALPSYPDQFADYGFAIGVFNVRFDRSDEEWPCYSQDIVDKKSCISLSFNFFTSYFYAENRRCYFYCAESCFVLYLCEHRYSKNVELLHDYGLYESTALLGKQI